MRRSAPNSLPNPSQTVRVPLWTVVALPLIFLVMLALVSRYGTGPQSQQERLKTLEAQAKTLTLELEAERTRTQTYSNEAVQLQQDLTVLEREINRLREKTGLPKVNLVPAAPAQPPQAAPGPKGAGEPVDTGDLLLSLRAQMGNFALSLEDTAGAIENPLPKDPTPQPRTRLLANRAPPQPQPLAPDPTQFMPAGMPLYVQTYISSGFGYRTSPFGGISSEFHNGLDFPAPMGTPVYVTASGKVDQVGWNSIFGLMILIDHENGLYTLYGHLSEAKVTQGQSVGQGELIGAVGSTGRSTGPHLHYTVYRYGSAVDPTPYVSALARR
ncbi:MAG: peptidase M23 [Meiothermus sp.]